MKNTKSIYALNVVVIAISALITLFYPLATVIKAERPEIQWMRGGTAFGAGSMGYSPDGTLFVSTESGFDQVKIWRNSDGMLLRTIQITGVGAVGGNKLVKFAPDGQHILVICIENTRYNVKLARISDGAVIRTFGDELYISTFGMMPDGTLAMGSGQQTSGSQWVIKFFDFSSGSLVRTLINITYVNSSGTTLNWRTLRGVGAFSESGRISVGTPHPSNFNASESAVINGDGTLVGYFPSSGGAAIISHDGSLGYGGGNLYRLSQLCYPTTSICSVPSAAQLPSSNATFSNDGQIIAIQIDNGSNDVLNFYHTNNGTLIRSVPLPYGLNRPVFSPDNQTIAANTRINSPIADSSVAFLRVSDGTLTRRLEAHTTELSHVLFSPNGQTIATVSANLHGATLTTAREKIIKIWNASNGALIREIPTGIGSGSVSQNQLAVFSPDGQFIFHGTPLNSVQVWRVSDGVLVRTIPLDGTRGIAVSPNGQIIASINANSNSPNGYSIELYNTSNGSLIRRLAPPVFQFSGMPIPKPAATFSVAFTPDGQTLVAAHPFLDTDTATYKGFIRFYNVSTGTGAPPIEILSPFPLYLAISPSGQNLALVGTGVCPASGCGGGFPLTTLTELRRISDGSLIRSFAERPGSDFIVRFTPDGQKIVTAGTESAIRFWNISDGTLAKFYDEEMTIDRVSSGSFINVPSLSFSADGSRFAYSRRDATLVVANNPFNQNSGRAPFDFDGDGKTDLSVFRLSDGVWYLNRSTSGFSAVRFGLISDSIVPADFDGDGKDDVAVFRQGSWYILQSSNNLVSAISFGSAGDMPRPGDFDGDGKADICVFRPSNGTWYRLNSSNGQFVALRFGQSGDVPLISDFDGDGKTDITVFRPSSGSWYYLKSSNSEFAAVNFGISSDIPSVGDFDGDGKSDISVFRPSNGVWYRLNSGNGQFAAVNFGISEDLPTVGDYDGDFKDDIAVFRPSTGTWYLLQSQNGFAGINFGLNTDQPTPYAFSR